MHYIKQCTANDTNRAPDKVLIGAMLTLRHQCVKIECIGLILYYTPTISIKKHCFYQIPFDALNEYNWPGALWYGASNGVLLNTTHRPWYEPHTQKSIYHRFIHLKALVCQIEHTDWISYFRVAISIKKNIVFIKC